MHSNMATPDGEWFLDIDVGIINLSASINFSLIWEFDSMTLKDVAAHNLSVESAHFFKQILILSPFKTDFPKRISYC